MTTANSFAEQRTITNTDVVHAHVIEEQRATKESKLSSGVHGPTQRA